MENAKKPTEVWLMNGVLEKIKKEKMIIIYFVSLLILMLVITGCAGGLDEPSAKNTALPSESKMAEAAEYLQSSRYVTKIMASGNWRIMKNHWTAASMAIQSVPCSQKSFGSDVSLYGKRI